MSPYSEIKLRIPFHCQHRHKIELSFTRFFKIYSILKFCPMRAGGLTLVKNPFSPSFPLETKLLVSMDYLLKSEGFHWGSELVLGLAKPPCTVIWGTTLHTFLYAKGVQHSHWSFTVYTGIRLLFLVFFLMVWVHLLLLLQLLPLIIRSTSFQPSC